MKIHKKCCVFLLIQFWNRLANIPKFSMLQQATPPSFSMYERMIVPYNEGANPFFECCHHAADSIHGQAKKPRACPSSSGNANFLKIQIDGRRTASNPRNRLTTCCKKTTKEKPQRLSRLTVYRFPLTSALFTKCAFDLYFLLYIYHFLRPLTVKRFFM